MPNVRDQLFDAAERVLLRDGADALTSRAVTDEAGVAKGVLHRHFPDFTTFLAGLVLNHIEAVEHQSTELRAAAGNGTVQENIANALTTALTAQRLAIVSLVMSRLELLDRLRLTTPTGIPILTETTKMIAAYLTAERGLGRIPLGTDVDRLAPTLVGAAHLHAASDQWPASDPVVPLDLVTASLASSFVPRPQPLADVAAPGHS
jgi:AcrR family transcriptional regulator